MERGRRAFDGITLQIKVMTDGRRKIEVVKITDTVALRRMLDKYSLLPNDMQKR